LKIDFKEVTVRNFLSFGNAVTTFRLDKYPFVIITGENGVGKSSIVVEAIHFVLFGKTLRRITKKEICNNINKRDCQVTVKFVYNDKTEYLIERGIAPDYISVTNLTAGTKPEDSRSSKKLIQQEIDKILGFDQVTLKNICVLSINNTKSFVDLTAEETRNVVENIMGIQIFSAMLEEVKKKLKASKDMLEISKKDIILYKGLVEDYNEKLRRSEIFKANFEKERQEKIKSVTETIISKSKEIGLFKTEMETIIPGDEIFRPETKKIEPVDTERFDKEIETQQEKINTFLAVDDSVTREKEKYDRMIVSLTNTHEKEILRLNTEQRLLVSKKDNVENDILKLKKSTSDLEKRIEYFKVTDFCPICNSTLNEEHREAEISKLTKQQHDNDILIEFNQKIIVNNDNKVKSLTEEILNIIANTKAEKIVLKTEYDKSFELVKKVKKEKLDKLEKDLEYFKHKKAKFLEAYQKKVDKIEKENEELLNEYDTKVKERQKKLDQISSLQSGIDHAKRVIEYSKEQIIVYETDSIDKHVDNLIDIEKIKEYQLKYDSLLQEKEVQDINIRYLAYQKDVLSDAGVKANIIKKDIPFLNQSINDYLSQLGKTFGIEFNEEFEISLNSFNKRNLSYQSLSEGEKKRTDLSILLSFLALTRKKNSINCSMLIFDEALDSSLDHEGRKLLIDILKKKIETGEIRNVFIISHNKNLQLDEAEKIEIINEGGFSKVLEAA